jgi:hypothetical protein
VCDGVCGLADGDAEIDLRFHSFGQGVDFDAALDDIDSWFEVLIVE